MTSQQYLDLRQLRESKAEAHYRQMCSKYEVIIRQRLLQEKIDERAESGLVIVDEFSGEVVYNALSKANDYTNWWDWQYYGGSRYQHYETPKSYSGEYFGYFIKAMMQVEFNRLKPWLCKQFSEHCKDQEYLDEIDRDYIEGLLDEAEVNWKMHLDGALLVIQGGGWLTGYGPEPGVNLTRVEGVATSDTLQSGENYRRRAARIRKWCDEWKLIEELAPISKVAQPTSSLDVNAPSTGARANTQMKAFRESATSSDEPLEEEIYESRRAGQSADRVELSLDSELSSGMKTEHCDMLAKSIFLCPPGNEYIYLTDGHARIWALADAIKDRECASGSARKLAKLLGNRYGYTVADKLTKKNGNSTYEGRFGHVRSAINEMRERKEF